MHVSSFFSLLELDCEIMAYEYASEHAVGSLMCDSCRRPMKPHPKVAFLVERR